MWEIELNYKVFFNKDQAGCFEEYQGLNYRKNQEKNIFSVVFYCLGKNIFIIKFIFLFKYYSSLVWLFFLLQVLFQLFIKCFYVQSHLCFFTSFFMFNSTLLLYFCFFTFLSIFRSLFNWLKIKFYNFLYKVILV